MKTIQPHGGPICKPRGRGNRLHGERKRDNSSGNVRSEVYRELEKPRQKNGRKWYGGSQRCSTAGLVGRHAKAKKDIA